jgi:capsular exopolysaccharide synthesis family protein
MSKLTPLAPTVTDAISALYANIRFAQKDNPTRSIVITSATAGEGKSFVALRLAEAMAKSGRKTLLVDANCHAPVLAGQLGMAESRGLYDAVATCVGLADAATATATGVENLSFADVGEGVAAPADFFGSDAFAALLEQMISTYDYVVFDTPALEPFIDAAVLASGADATVLVVRQHAVSRDGVAAACDQLGKAHAHVVGVALNACED